MKFNIYYNTDRKRLLKENVSKENTEKFINTLTLAEKTHITLERVEEREYEER